MKTVKRYFDRVRLNKFVFGSSLLVLFGWYFLSEFRTTKYDVSYEYSKKIVATARSTLIADLNQEGGKHASITKLESLFKGSSWTASCNSFSLVCLVNPSEKIGQFYIRKAISTQIVHDVYICAHTRTIPDDLQFPECFRELEFFISGDNVIIEARDSFDRVTKNNEIKDWVPLLEAILSKSKLEDVLRQNFDQIGKVAQFITREHIDGKKLYSEKAPNDSDIVLREKLDSQSTTITLNKRVKQEATDHVATLNRFSDTLFRDVYPTQTLWKELLWLIIKSLIITLLLSFVPLSFGQNSE